MPAHGAYMVPSVSCGKKRPIRKLRVFGSALLQGGCLAVMLAGSITLCHAVPAYAASNLSAALLSAQDVSASAHLDSEKTLVGADIYDDPGAAGDVKRANVVGGVARRYTTDDLTVVIMLVEFTNNDWANEPVRSLMQEDAPDLGTGVRIVRGENRGRLYEAASVAKGRVNVQVWVTSSVAGSRAAIHEQVRRVLQAEIARVPLLADLKRDANSPAVIAGRVFGYWLGVVTALVVLGFAIWGQIVASLRDQGSREWSVHHWFAAHPITQEVTLFDVTPQVKRQDRRQTAIWGFATLGLAVSLGVLLAWPGLRLWIGLAVVATLIIIVSVGAPLLSQRRTDSAEAQGTGAALILGLGGAASGLVVMFGVLMIGGAIAGWLLLQRLSAVAIVVPMALCGLALVNGSRRPVRFARRLLQPTVRLQIEGDDRRPVLLLRSFQDDSLEVRPPAAQDSAVDAFAGDAFAHFEEVVAWRAWSVGPVLAVGQPGTVLQPLGAVRNYYSDDEWQTAVETHSEVALAVVLVVGRSPGLVWEIQNLRQRGRLAKVVFVLPPVSPAESLLRSRVLASTLDLDPSVLEAGTHRMALVLRFDVRGRPVLYVCAGRPGPAYDEAVGLALSHVPPIVPFLTSPAPEVTVPGDNVSDLLVTFDPASVAPARKPVIARLADVGLNFVP